MLINKRSCCDRSRNCGQQTNIPGRRSSRKNSALFTDNISHHLRCNHGKALQELRLISGGERREIDGIDSPSSNKIAAYML